MVHRLQIDHLAGAARHAYLASALEYLEADSRRLAGFRVDVSDVRDVERRLLLDDAAGIAGRGPRMPLDHVDALHQDARLVAQDPQHLAGLALLLAGADDHLVAFPDLELHCHSRTCSAARYALENFRRERNDLHEILGP